jgi:predicted DNA-binding transcriptional regulator AlpA
MTNMASRRRKKSERPAQPMPPEADSYSIEEFCRRHSISRPTYYMLRAKKIGPKETRLGGKILITRESAARWRKEREAASNAAE